MTAFELRQLLRARGRDQGDPPSSQPPVTACATWSPTGESIAFVASNGLYPVASLFDDPVRVTSPETPPSSTVSPTGCTKEGGFLHSITHSGWRPTPPSLHSPRSMRRRSTRTRSLSQTTRPRARIRSLRFSSPASPKPFQDSTSL
ncbi:uncharacterized protein B0H18DRAFT_1030199, partial [Fomitopsis serialis]|uniref:uncharacterized protein n=1 Tax=Fomitopsis serialis TaxID=139415 RepID=UPI002007A966